MNEPYFHFPPEGFTLPRTPRAALVHCLRVAATRFDNDAQASVTPAFRERMTRQAAEAREIADRLEAAATIHVGTVKVPE